jgi:hypothetical protein
MPNFGAKKTLFFSLAMLINCICLQWELLTEVRIRQNEQQNYKKANQGDLPPAKEKTNKLPDSDKTGQCYLYDGLSGR